MILSDLLENLSESLTTRRTKELSKYISSLKKEERIELRNAVWKMLPEGNSEVIRQRNSNGATDLIGYAFKYRTDLVQSLFREPPNSHHQTPLAGATQTGVSGLGANFNLNYHLLMLNQGLELYKDGKN